MELRSDDLTLVVPLEWKPEAVFTPDSPFTLIRIERPSRIEREAMLAPSPSPTFHPLDRTLPPVVVPRPYLALTASKVSRETASGGDAAASLTRSEREGDGIERHAEHGSHWWLLERTSAGYRYAVGVRVDDARFAELSGTVERVMASVRLRT
jgi:hypothetical protein